MGSRSDVAIADGPRTVVNLDEADQLEDPSVIYDLRSLPQFAIICTSDEEEEDCSIASTIGW
nr:hypothetical protein [Natronococcus pandeyae]